MFKKLLSLLVLLSFVLTAFSQEIKSPEAFLGYRLGERFTPHYRIIEYFKYVAQVSKNVKLVQYGSSNEGRPLYAMFIASDENISRLEEIRQNNLRLAGLEKVAVNGSSTTETIAPANSAAATISVATPVICWLSYNVHGNEPASSEAAMLTLFDVVNPANAQTRAWLKNTVVVIDPCLNPDGRERYINFYNSVRGTTPDANPSSREHQEPWPGGRINHYYFDLNRDWAWQTQKETQARLALYSQWLPQVHVDYHEQGYNAPYYFAPAAEPFHRDITAWQREFQTIIGKNNAKYFDQNGWLYFTKQEFDMLYPSYGDTYPTYNGAIGMTYEQGGISAGLAVVTRTGDTLTLTDRITHHHTTGLSTLEVVSANAQRLLTEFKKFYDNSSNNPPGDYKTYIIKNDNHDKIEHLGELLRRNGIQYSFGLNQSINGYSYLTGKNEQYAVKPADMVINAYQPKSVLLNVLLEPKTFMTDSNTYDITAWSLPYAYGLEAYGLKEALKPVKATITNVALTPSATSLHAYAYASAWRSVNDVKFLAALLRKGIKVRYSSRPFEAGGKKFAEGSLLVARAGNDRQDFDQVVTETAAEFAHELTPLKTGFVEKGYDLGSDVIRYIRQPRVMLVTGEGVNAEAMGEVWHFFDQQINYPITLVKYQDLNRVRLSDFDVAIFPDGNYEDFPSDKLQGWARDGGKLILMENAVTQVLDKKGFNIKKKDDKKDDKSDDKSKGTVKAYDERNNEAIRSSVPGAIYKLNLDNTHPLGYGLPPYYYAIKLSDDIYDYFGDDGWNVGTVKKDGYVSGFVGQKSREKIKNGLLLGVQSLGRGTVVYFVDDPIFRSFWENGKLLFGNAVFMVGQ